VIRDEASAVTLRRVKGAMVAFALMFATAGCAAAHKGGPYAGMEPYDVGSAAQEIITQETAMPASPLHDRELVVADEHKGVLPSTRRPAWVISMENFDHVKSKYCLYVWGRFTPFQGSHVRYDVESCPGSSGV
jgi:hypothetical protein